MTKQLSFSRIENELLPDFRKKIGTAESVEDVKKFYAYTIQKLFSRVFPEKVEMAYDDIKFQPEQDPPFAVSSRLRDREDFASVWNSSDLSRVIARFAETAAHRYRHLEKNPGKTEAKIRK